MQMSKSNIGSIKALILVEISLDILELPRKKSAFPFKKYKGGSDPGAYVCFLLML